MSNLQNKDSETKTDNINIVTSSNNKLQKQEEMKGKKNSCTMKAC